MKPFASLPLLTAGLAACVGTHAVSAQTNAAPAVVEEIVVTSSRMPRDMQSEPAAVYRLDPVGASTRTGLRTMPDLVQGVPSAMAQKTGYGQGSPFLRGFTGFRTLCLIDGIRLNNAVFRDGPNQYWNTVDPLSLASAELVMGPGSVLYGSDAVGGVLNAIPVTPPEYAGTPSWERRLFYRGATADRSNMGRAQVGGRLDERFGFVGGISLKSFGDVRGGDDVGRQRHTGYDEQDYDGQLTWDMGENARLTLGHQTVNQDDAWRTHRTIYGIDWHGLARGDDLVHTYDQHRDLTYLKYRADDVGGAVDALQWTASRQNQAEDLYRVKKDGKRDLQSFDVVTWGASFQLESDTPAGDWVYGADFYRDLVDSDTRKFKADGRLDKVEIQGPVADDATYDMLGVFAQDTIRLLDGSLDVTPGARYTWARADANRVKDPISGKAVSLRDDWSAVSGSLRLLHPLVEDRSQVVYASVAQGFRAPNLSDLTRLDIARSNEIETPAPGLDPEHFISWEVGYKARLDWFTTQVSAYHTYIDNLIVRTPTGRTIDESVEVTKRNSGEGYVQGLEWSAAVDLTPCWSGWLALSWMDGEVDAYPTSEAAAERDYLTRLMPPTAQTGLRWERRGGRCWAELVGQFAEDADRLSADDRRDTQRIPPGGTPGYAVCHLRTGARVCKGFEVGLALENLFDTDYRIHGSGINEPGRNLVLTTNLTF